MIWWFLILGVSALVVICALIALYMRLRRHLQKSHVDEDGSVGEAARQRDRTQNE